eukprot:CAMPEP_0170180794 /NCGR_PEP_ID=MMETSP0040_2-20121228/23041_1 /TAXON_ID=641309 /ORGANISM="Lotharella oceanica, Strain CCMP622" /LENGTH=237 /DNA_ID=CAMNT_0010425559 /DNA_START=138 /DNA_END=851 /DNA_ORIENTATION=-
MWADRDIAEFHNASLLEAAAQGNLEAVRDAVRKGGDAKQARDADGTNALVACISKEFDNGVMRYLVEEARADVSAADKYGFDALTTAAHFGVLVAVRYLVEEAKADAHAKTPLVNAAQNYRLDIVKYLVEKAQVDVSRRDDEGYTALDRAVSYVHLRDLKLIKYLVDVAGSPLDDHLFEMAEDIRDERRDVVMFIAEAHRRRKVTKIVLPRDCKPLWMLHKDIISAVREEIHSWYLG